MERNRDRGQTYICSLWHHLDAWYNTVWQVRMFTSLFKRPCDEHPFGSPRIMPGRRAFIKYDVGYGIIRGLPIACSPVYIWTATWENVPYMRPKKTQISQRIRAGWSVFVVRIKKICILGYPKYAQLKSWLDCANAFSNVAVHNGH